MSFEQEPVGRRDLLKAVAGAGAALGLANGVWGRQTGMYVSLHPALTDEKPEWPEFARLAARIGYGGVDMNKEAAMKEGLDATRALFAELKIKPAIARPSLMPDEILVDEGRFQVFLRRLSDIASFAAALQCMCMSTPILASSQTPKPELRRIYKDRLIAIAETLRRSKLRFGLEFVGVPQARKGPHEFIWRMDEMLEFSKECGSNVGLLVDSWHWYHAGATPSDIIAAGKSRVVYVHVADCARVPPEQVRDRERLMPGEGVIDLVGFFRALQKIGYQGGVAPEVFGRTKGMSPEEGARLGLESTLAVMRKAGAA